MFMNLLLLNIVNVNTCFGSSETISINSMRSVLRILSCPIQVGIYVFYSLTFIAVQCKIVSSKEIQLWNKILMTLSSNHLVRTFKLQYFNCHAIASVQTPAQSQTPFTVMLLYRMSILQLAQLDDNIPNKMVLMVSHVSTGFQDGAKTHNKMMVIWGSLVD